MNADFRSDTVTLPTQAMRAAMAAAEVGDDVMGEDPTVRALEAEAAAVLGTEAALFVPSGTMANQVATHVHCRPGDELLCEERSHVYRYEGGGIARLSGAQVRPLPAPEGFLSSAQVAAALSGDDPHYARSRLLVVENSHNMAGGRVLPPDRWRALVTAARDLGLAVHVDGARLLNAAVACGCDAAELVAGADSVSLCLSKGLGAPVGSVVAGSDSFVAEARRVRKAFGGGMRQAGVIAAAARLALRDGPGWLAEDHRRAAALGRGLGGIAGLRLVAPPETNIVLVDIDSGDANPLLAALRERGVLAAAVAPGRVRFVTHHDLDDDAVARCIDAAAAWQPGQIAS